MQDSVKQEDGRVVWRPVRNRAAAAWPTPPLLTAMRRGVFGRCPACGQGPAFAGWLRVTQTCPVCTAPLGTIRADDAPPYFTVFILAHIVIGALVALERSVTLSVTTELMIFLPATLLLAVGLIRPVKGATLGLMLRMDMGQSAETGDIP